MSSAAAKAAAEERQLKPLYEALDNGNTKAALQVCNKILKKNGKSQIAAAFKVLALVRAAKLEEANILLNKIIAQKPTDEGVLAALGHSLKPLDRPVDLITLYNDAWTANPKSEELGAQTFMAHVRTGRWSGALTTARKLYKQFPSERYLWWGVMAASMQAERPHPPLPVPVLVMIPTAEQLAEREATLARERQTLAKDLLYEMALRMISTTSPADVTANSAERAGLVVALYLKKAQALADKGAPEAEVNAAFENAVKFLNSETGKKATAASLHVQELRRTVLTKTGQLEQDLASAKESLKNGNRNWLTFLTYLDAFFAQKPNTEAHTNGTEANGTDEKPNGPETLAEVRGFLNGLAQSDQDSAPNDRSARLAIIELESKVRAKKLQDGDAPNYVELLTSYYTRLSSRAVVVEDLISYVKALEGDERAAWDAFLKSQPLDVTSVKALQATINVIKFQRFISTASPEPESELAFAKQVIDLYVEALPLGDGRASTDLHPADDLGIIAAEAIISAYHSSDPKPVSLLLHAITLLEYILSKSQYCYGARLLLVRLYRLLGAPQSAITHYRAAGIKNIQNDTLSHHILSRASDFSLGSSGDLTLINECAEASQVYTLSTNETSEQVLKAFQWEKYSQISDFVTLEEKLDGSLQRDLTKMEHLRMKMLFDGLNTENVEVELVELRYMHNKPDAFDNRDFDLLPNYLIGGRSIENDTAVNWKPISQQWYLAFLKFWVLALHLASEQLWTEKERETELKKLSTFTDEELEQLTPAERKFINYGLELIDWLEPHHLPIKHQVMTNGVSVLQAAKNKTTTPAAGKKGAPAKKPATNGSTSSASDDLGADIVVPVKPQTGMLTLQEPVDVPALPEGIAEKAIKEPPEALLAFFDEWQTLFDTTIKDEKLLPWEIYHITHLSHELVFLVHLLTARFANGAGKKKSHPNYKVLRQKATDLLNHVASEITRLSEAEGSTEQRNAFVDDRKASPLFEKLPEEKLITVGKGLYDSRKKTLEALGKGLTKAVTVVSKQAGNIAQAQQ